MASTTYMFLGNVDFSMRVLYLINAGIMGGRERHVMTLVKSLPKEIEYCICAVSAGEATDRMFTEGLNVRVLGGRNGHDWRIVPRFIRLMWEFRPDIVHAHSMPFLAAVVLRFYPRVPVVKSIHGTTVSGEEWKERRKSPAWKMKGILQKILQRKADYYLPVSMSTWNEFKSVNPDAKGEVFFNALKLEGLPEAEHDNFRRKKVVGMVGRNADQKDWPLFCKVARSVLAKRSDIEFWGVGADSFWAKEKCGEDSCCVKWFGSRQDARELIARMDIFLMTSKHEQLPTTLLEAFYIGVPVVGVLPEGGTREVLALSTKTSALLLPERDCEKVAAAIVRIIDDPKARADMVGVGKGIVMKHFDMEKLCATQLMGIYRGLIKE